MRRDLRFKKNDYRVAIMAHKFDGRKFQSTSTRSQMPRLFMIITIRKREKKNRNTRAINIYVYTHKIYRYDKCIIPYTIRK